MVDDDSKHKLQNKTEQKQKQSTSAFKVYCPPPSPPLPQNQNHHHQQQPFILPLHKNEANGSTTNSHFSTLSGDTESLQRSCLSSGFQISHVSMQGGSFKRKPPLSTNSVKRKCNSTGFPDTKLEIFSFGMSLSSYIPIMGWMKKNLFFLSLDVKWNGCWGGVILVKGVGVMGSEGSNLTAKEILLCWGGSRLTGWREDKCGGKVKRLWIAVGYFDENGLVSWGQRGT